MADPEALIALLAGAPNHERLLRRSACAARLFREARGAFSGSLFDPCRSCPTTSGRAPAQERRRRERIARCLPEHALKQLFVSKFVLQATALALGSPSALSGAELAPLFPPSGSNGWGPVIQRKTNAAQEDLR